MFDTSKQFAIKTIDGKCCTVRFPSDQEWCDRARKQKLIRRDLGRNKSQYDSMNAKRVDAELFAKIRLDVDGAEFDEHDAAFVIERLDRVTVQSVDRIGDQYTVTLRVPKAVDTPRVDAVHTLRLPSQKQVDDYAAASSPPPIHGERTTEMRVFLDPAGPMYDSLAVSHEGYAGAVPITHKLAALSAMLRDIQAQFEDDDPEE